MSNYNTFIVIDCNNKKNVLTTSSARKANKSLIKGFRVDVWNNNKKVDTIYQITKDMMKPYIEVERQYIRQKQAKAEARNKERKRKRELNG